MLNSTKIPAIPTSDVRFEKGRLNFNVLSGCAYSPSLNGFVGGDWTKAHIRTKIGEPVWIKLEGGELVIEKLTDCLLDAKTGNYVGGRVVEIARFNV